MSDRMRLVPRGAAGLCCDEAGLALGPVPLVIARRDALGRRHYEAQSEAALARMLTLADPTLGAEALACSIDEIGRIAAALNAGDAWRARAMATRLGLPPLTLAAMARLAAGAGDTAKAISPGLGWNPARHPRWPSGQSDGGRFRPNDGDGEDISTAPILPVAARAGKPQAKAPAKPHAKPQSKPQRPVTPPSTAWKNYPNPEMREKLAELESSVGKENDGYGQPSSPGHRAIGRYQFLPQALVEAGWKDKKGHWTEKAKEAGVTNEGDFIASPDAQERALTDLLQIYTKRLKTNGAYAKIGTTVQDSGGQDLRITEAGLLAAAHKEGAFRVKQYLDPTLRANLKPDQIKNIEHRLREAADTPYDAAAMTREANTSDRGPNANKR